MIQSVQRLAANGVSSVAEATGAAPVAEGFAETLVRAVEQVDQQQIRADDALYRLATGDGTDLHTAMIALEEASIALRTLATTRDRLVEAYQQLWNMPI